MASVFDIAKFILKEQAEKHVESNVTTWKLQKLVYYCQAWSTVWDDTPLFGESIEAWANGPVCRVLYERHRGSFKISLDDIRGDLSELSPTQEDTIHAVLECYGDKTAHYLSELTHQEAPWVEARKGLDLGERGDHVITLDSMAEYYGGLCDH